jgi:alkylation response protein AidB-like acyl-CoA dehydrogenase
VVVGPDEHKMGIKGSSTAQIYYNDVKVPVENLLGARGEGFRIALSILHMGRIKLGANVIGAARKAIIDSVRYANERKQFGVLISTFGAIKQKLALQVIKTFATESAIYRVSKQIDDLAERYKSENCEKGRASIDAISHYAIEAAILKVYGSEMLDYVVDEAVQIHGGMGYSAEMAVERAYRDSRINRIFEGTNEINRLLVVDTTMKRAMKGDFDLFGEAEKVYATLGSVSDGRKDGESYADEKLRYAANFKKVALMITHAASKAFDKKLLQEQEVLNCISDIIMETYVAESVALRVLKLESMKGHDQVYRDIADIYIYNAASKIRKAAIDAVYSTLEGPDAGLLHKAVDSLTAVAGVNVKEGGRRIADKLISDNDYKF